MNINITQREEEVASYLIKGATNYEIAHILGISSFTLKKYITNLLGKFNAKNRTELAYKLGKNNII